MTALTVFFLFFAGSRTIEAQSNNTMEELVFTVYPDGFTAVDHFTEVDPTLVRVNITLFGSLFQDILVEDQDGLPLDFSLKNHEMTIDVLGSYSVSIYYVTPDLTDKSGQLWFFKVSTPVLSSVLFPEDTTVVGFNVNPIAVGSLEGSPLLTMPAGDFEISYIVGVVGTREHALAVIIDAESTVEEIKKSGVRSTEAENLLQQAYTAFNAEQYVEAEQLADEAKKVALSASAAESSAKEAIDSATEKISAALDEGRTVGLDTARSLLEEAEEAYTSGNYADSEALALQAESAADTAEASGPPISSLVFLIVAFTFVFIAAVFLLRIRKPKLEKSVGAVDLDGIFEETPNLRLDDREVIRFLAKFGGEAFISEIRERFDIPRTSAWRMIRRLQREEVVVVKKIGGQNLVKINSKYLVGGRRAHEIG
jgi:uncharacterized membrane protein